MTDIELLAGGAGVLVLGISVVLLWRGVTKYRWSSALADAVPFDAEPTASAMVAIEGVIDDLADGQPLESRMSATPCVAYSARRITKRTSGDVDVRRASSGQYRKRVKERTDAVPFVLQTDAGPVHVDADAAQVDVSDDDYAPVSLGDVRENRGTVVGLWWLIRGVLAQGNEQYHREYEEACFSTGDTLRVIGRMEGSDAAGWRLGRDGGPPLVLTSRSTDDVAGTVRSAATSRLLGGMLALGLGVALLAVSAGLV